jgi:hypothetical protein
MVALGTIYSKKMKAIQINSAINLTSGLSIPSGSLVVISEGYANIKDQKNGIIPAQISTSVFTNATALAEGKSSIQGIEDFNTSFSGLELSVTAYETQPAETLLIDAIFGALNLIYPDQVEIVTV